MAPSVVSQPRPLQHDDAQRTRTSARQRHAEIAAMDSEQSRRGKKEGPGREVVRGRSGGCEVGAAASDEQLSAWAGTGRVTSRLFCLRISLVLSTEPRRETSMAPWAHFSVFTSRRGAVPHHAPGAHRHHAHGGGRRRDAGREVVRGRSGGCEVGAAASDEQLSAWAGTGRVTSCLFCLIISLVLSTEPEGKLPWHHAHFSVFTSHRAGRGAVQARRARRHAPGLGGGVCAKSCRLCVAGEAIEA